ncbi:hypothetical protein GCM10022409_17060 [Hymenobacter glaciei]|uniref:Uncharacterized protein n=1 Tax=Hymenobacter glaciei TaxID=877209 RepID=A0ABP7TYV3_9BACT
MVPNTNTTAVQDHSIVMNAQLNAVESNPQKKGRNQNKAGYVAAYIIIITIASVWMFSEAYRGATSFTIRTKWENQDSIALGDYPDWFYYSRPSNDLIIRVPLNDSSKTRLLKLIDSKQKSYPEFRNSINQLAFLSEGLKTDLLLSLLWLSAWSAVIGVQIRTIFDFIGVICYTDEGLDISVWWPWYLLRPLMGFTIGPLIIILTKTHFFNTSSANGDITYIAIAAIAGFGVVEVVDRLRLISKTLFGAGNSESKKKKVSTEAVADNKTDSD